MSFRLKIFQIISLVIIGTVFLLLPQHNSYALRARNQQIRQIARITFPSPKPLAVNVGQNNPPELTASAIVVLDQETGMVLYEKNPDTPLPPASTTKIMTALVALDSYALEDVVTVKTLVTEPQLMGLRSGEKITVENLLYGIMVHSGNDAALALAEHFEGSTAKFVEAMNAKAKALYLTSTNYVNPIGFDDPNQLSSARDLARLTRYAMQNKFLAKIVGISQISVPDATFSYYHQLKNINQLLGKVPGVTGFKTGLTQAAGECLVTTSQKNGSKVITVVLGSEDRFGETEELLKWVYANFEWRQVSESG